MKPIALILVLLMAAAPASAASRKIGVQQLKETLLADQQAGKADADVANDLKQVVLTEELTSRTVNELVQYSPGAQALEQLYVLEAKSAVLPPPASDLPLTPAPDAATKEAILDKALVYAAKTYAQLPNVSATKTTIRFQDNASAMAGNSGSHSAANASGDADPTRINAAQSVHYINSTQGSVTLHSGIEDNPLARDKTRWGQNGYIALLGQGPVLSTVLGEANGAEKLAWLRWETVNGKAAAVYSFSVDKKKSHYAVDYCCFPYLEQAGVAHGNSDTESSMNQVSSGAARGNFQTSTSYTNFRAIVPYHGEIFVDPDTGVVVRLITQAEFKDTEVVHQEDQRIDYAPVVVGGKTLVLPYETIVDTEVVPNGDSGGGTFVLRHTLFTSEYNSYRAGN